MNRISVVFNDLKKRDKRAFIPFLMAGDPDLNMSKKLVLEAENCGADIVELGIPYNAPLADGPTIQKAGQRGLKNKINFSKIFDLVKEIRFSSQIPLVLMGYYNLIFNYGVEKFVKESEKSGIDGVIIPDLPLGEDEVLRKYSNKLDIILLIAPNSKKKRMKELAKKSQGFIYAVSTLGTTGTRGEISSQLKVMVEQIKEVTEVPVAVGFGISDPGHVKKISGFADGIIVGSAIIKELEANLDLLPENKNEFVQKIGKFISKLTTPL